MTLDIELQPHDKVIDLTPPWEHYCTKDVNPSILFSSHQEHQDTLVLGGMSHLEVTFFFSGGNLCFFITLTYFLCVIDTVWLFVLQDRLRLISLQTTPGILGKVASFLLSVGKVLPTILLSYMVR